MEKLYTYHIKYSRGDSTIDEEMTVVAKSIEAIDSMETLYKKVNGIELSSLIPFDDSPILLTGISQGEVIDLIIES